MKQFAKIIFSIDKLNDKKPPVAYEVVRNTLNGRGVIYEETQGSYVHDDGTQVIEPSFSCIWLNQEAFRTVEHIAKLYNQESILLIDSDMKCYLRFLGPNANQTEKYIGKWTQVETSEQLDKTKPYTKLGDKYFVCKL